MARSHFLNQKLLAVAITQAVACSAHAATITVDSLADDIDTVGTDCTLRSAIASANSDAAVAGCVTGAGADTIVFDPTVLPGTIALAGTQLRIASAITLQGPGADQLTIDAGAGSRVLNIDDGDINNDLAVTIAGLTLSGGVANSGGGIRSREILSLNNSTISGNSAQGDGGGIYFFRNATASLNNSTISGNSASFGGGIYSARDAAASLNNSTISGNSAERYGGGIYSARDATASLNNSTISGNYADFGGGIIDLGGTLSLSNSTISTNVAQTRGGGIFSFGSNSLNNSTLSGNSANDGGGIYSSDGSLSLNNMLMDNINGNCSGLTPTGDNNIFSDASCLTGGANQVVADTGIGPLQDNGGPTLTHALLRNSPAIGAGNGCPVTDQRGIVRKADCDIGAYHWRGFDSADIVVNSTADSVADDGACTLREALIAANTDTASGLRANECVAGERDDTVTFNPSVTGTINLSGTQLEIASPATLQGPGADQLTIDAGGNSRVLLVNDRDFSNSIAVTIAGLTLSGGNLSGSGSGGGVSSVESLSLNNSTISGNSAIDYGGGVFSFGTLSVNDSTISGNFAQDDGGGISSINAALSVNNSTINGNLSEDDGGGIFSFGTFSLNNSTISGNSAQGDGGGISSFNGTLSLNNSTLSENTANDAGGIYSRGETTVSLNNMLMDNIGNCLGGTWTGDTNLFTDNTCLTGGANQVVDDTGIGPLQDNGGPTLTHALLPGSPAIDAGNNAICSNTDQTGMRRPIDGDSNGNAICDVGAFEFTGSIVSDALFTDGFENP